MDMNTIAAGDFDELAFDQWLDLRTIIADLVLAAEQHPDAVRQTLAASGLERLRPLAIVSDTGSVDVVRSPAHRTRESTVLKLLAPRVDRLGLDDHERDRLDSLDVTFPVAALVSFVERIATLSIPSAWTSWMNAEHLTLVDAGLAEGVGARGDLGDDGLPCSRTGRSERASRPRRDGRTPAGHGRAPPRCTDTG